MESNRRNWAISSPKKFNRKRYFSIISVPNTYSTGEVIYAAAMNANFSTIYSDYDGGIIDANISGSANIASSKLASITTAGKVSGTSFTALASIPSLAGVIPAANLPASATPSDTIARGFELVYSSTAALVVNPGLLFNGSTTISKTATTTLTLATAANWYDGATHTFGGGAGFCYVGVDSSGNIKLLGANPPNKADTSGNTAGTLLYSYISTTYWRVIGAAWVHTDNTFTKIWFQQGNRIMYDAPIITTASYAADAWSAAVACNIGIPATSTLGIFRIQCGGSDIGTSNTTLKPYGATGYTPSVTNTMGIALSRYGAGTIECFTDSSQQISHYEVSAIWAPTPVLYIAIEGYYLNCR